MPPPAVETLRPVVLKLGGSLVTRKKEIEKLRPKVIARLAAELASVRDVPVILLHGAGSFGHPGAQRFGLAQPPGPQEKPAERTRGAAIVSTEVRRLHLAILRELIAAGLRPLSMPMATHARNRGGALASIDASPLEDALERGAMPVTFGDVVPDDDWGFSILSADTIAEALVPILRPSRVVFATDVPGILEKDRGARRAVIEEVTDELVESLPFSGAGRDVTGGIRGKAIAMRRIARAGVDAVLISGLTDGAVARAIRGESVYGSWARARPG
ncbi:MAG: isopentenyl phosphate kinase [Thermoplasmata archaeon]